MPPLKSLVVVRHAKSSWQWDDLNDFDRPLSERGKRDAPMMAQRLEERGIHPDLLVSSPAKRARKTAEAFAGRFGIDAGAIVFRPELYHAPSGIFFDVIGAFDDRFETIFLFSHNPGITTFVNELTSVQLDNMPTCGMFGVQLEEGKWMNFRTGARKFWFLDYPKAD